MRSRSRAAGFAASALALLLAAVGRAGAQPAAAPQSFFGQVVVTVAYSSDGPVDHDEVARLVTIKTGQPLTEEATGSTIRHLFATRRFADIRIEAEPAEGGVAVTILLFRSYRVNPLRFDDGVSVSKEELRRAVPFAEGAVFQAEELEEGETALKRRLDAEGYVNATVEPEVFFDPKTFDAEVIYHIEAGKPARTAPAFFDGDPKPFTREELLKKARLDPGDRYRETKARADADRMTKYMKKQMHLRGVVELIAAQPTDDGRVMPVYRVVVGPKIVFQTRGIREKKVRREVTDLLQGQIFDEDLILQYVENKRRGLQRKGYYRAKVDYTMSPEATDVQTVAINVEPGPKFAVEEIAIEGNQAVPEKQLRKLLVTQEKGLPLVRPGRLVDEVLKDDAGAILGYYQTHGWVNAKVEDPTVTEGSKPDRLVVNMRITEGPRALVTTRKVVGAEHVAEDQLDDILSVKVGEAFNPNEVRQDSFSLQNHYRNRGWREASVKDDWNLSPDGTAADVTYTVEEGMRSFFGKTIVRGNTRTGTDRITRLVTWDEGDPFSEQEVLTTQRNLTRTGVFRRVEIKPQPADPASQVRPVDIDVQEGRPLSLLYGFGYQYAPDALENRNDPFALAGVSYNNLFGTMRSASIDVQYAPISGRGRLIMTFREPFLFNRDLPLNVLFFFTREPIQKIDIERVGTVVDFPNNDRVFHNVFSFHDGKRFDLGLYPVGTVKQVKFDHPGLSRIFCNIHPNMAAYVMVVDTPHYSVSDTDGHFTIEGVGRGSYTYHAWRPGGPALTGSAVVEAGRHVPASTMSIALMATPGLGIVISAFALGEEIGASLVAGVALIGAGIAMATRAACGRTPACARAPAWLTARCRSRAGRS